MGSSVHLVYFSPGSTVISHKWSPELEVIFHYVCTPTRIHTVEKEQRDKRKHSGKPISYAYQSLFTAG